MQTFTVYLGSGGRARDVYKEQTQKLGAIIAQNNLHLMYGGMNAGLMGLLAQSALRGGAAVTGIIPRKIQDSERVMEGLTRTLLVEELCDRKRLMFEEGDVIIAMPGGFGTLDETLEALYWGTLKLHSKPLVLVNIEGYWDSLLKYLKTLPDYDERYCIVVDDVEEILPALQKWEALAPIQTPAHMPHFEDEITRDTDQPIIVDKATVENSYFIICALGLKQLGKHSRHIGFLNPQGIFNDLIDWINLAEKEHFITEKCLKLFDTAWDIETLHKTLDKQSDQSIDLHADKWGDEINS